jgi:hypothetical protein
MPRALRLVVVLLLVAAITWLGFRAVRAFDPDRHTAEAAAVLAAPDVVTYRLQPVPPAQGAPSPQGGQASPAPGQGAPNSPDGEVPAPGQGAPNSPDGGAPEREGSPTPGSGDPAVPSPPINDAAGRFSYRPGTWLSVVDLEGLDPVAGDERYLVFLRNWAGWTLVGAARPGVDGTAQVRSGAEPRPRTVYEVVVTRAVDDATSIPHGQPVLQWFDASLGPPRARRFDFARGV